MKANRAAQNCRILVIDDNPSIHEDFRNILAGNGARNPLLEEYESALFGPASREPESPAFAVESAFQGREGLEMVRRAVQAGQPYALAFVDVRMPPGWDGIETIKHIWQTYPDIQVVVCTAFSDYSWEEMTRQLGTSDSLVILKKPFENVEVLQLAHALTQKWCLNQQAKGKLEDLDRMVSRRTAELQAANQRLHQEIAERRTAEQALRLSEERFSKAFRSNPLPMVICSLHDERCVDANAQFLKMLDYGPQEVLGHPLPALQILADEPRWNTIRQELAASRPAHSVEYPLRTRSGAKRDTLLWAELMDVATEACVLLIIEDVTERRNLENQLHQAQKMEAVGQLASGVAHDFNNILTVIQGHVDLSLGVAHLEQRVTHSLKQVAAASARAAALTRQLLTFSRKQAVQPKVLRVREQLESLKEMLGRLIGEHIQLQWVCADSLPRIYADPCNFEQIVMNLAVNARDAMPQGGRLAIATTLFQLDEAGARGHPDAHPGEHVCLSVSDTGCGMTPEVLPRIFEPFFTTKEHGKGTGLGLATVYGIVKQLNGWIEVDTKPGKGTTFRVYLPAYQGAEPAQPVAPTTREPRQAKATILLVEDEATVRELACEVMTAAGHKVITAADGTQALRAWDEIGPSVDLLLTDIIMPNGISGRHLAEKLLADRRDLKVLFTSGYSQELIGEDSLLSEGHSFLPKPFTPPALLRAVQECLAATAPG